MIWIAVALISNSNYVCLCNSTVNKNITLEDFEKTVFFLQNIIDNDDKNDLDE